MFLEICSLCMCVCVYMACGGTCVIVHTRKAEGTTVKSFHPSVVGYGDEPGLQAVHSKCHLYTKILCQPSISL